MSPPEIARRLDNPLSVLTMGPRSAPARQQTLRAAIDWSYQLLAEPEQTLLRRLAVFRGGFTRGAATSVCTDVELPGGQIDDLLDRLVAQSLLVGVKQPEHTRFHRRPRRLHGGTLFLLNGLIWLAAAFWLQSVVTDPLRLLLLFMSAGASLSAALLANDSPGLAVAGAARRRPHRTRG